jgi:urocanate hydratase
MHANRNPNLAPRQDAVYQKYLSLQTIGLQAMAETRRDASLVGAWLVSCGMGREGAELAMASTLAGTAFLGIDPQPQRLKSAQQHNACDFMVNSLDEALRVLKNSLRKRQPISVGLLGSAAEVLPHLVERGVQPDFLSDTSEYPANVAASHSAHLLAIAHLAGRGAILMDFGNGLQAALAAMGRPTTVLDATSTSANATESAHAAESLVRWITTELQDCKRMDELALSLLPPTDVARRRWLEGASAYFHRQTPLERVLSLSTEERFSLLRAVENPLLRARLRGPLILCWLDAKQSSQTLRVEPLRPSPTA